MPVASVRREPPVDHSALPHVVFIRGEEPLSPGRHELRPKILRFDQIPRRLRQTAALPPLYVENHTRPKE